MTEPASTGTKLRVLVIGAGYAGIAAAKRLAANPAVHVTVLEASSSVGGRAKAGQVRAFSGLATSICYKNTYSSFRQAPRRPRPRKPFRNKLTTCARPLNCCCEGAMLLLLKHTVVSASACSYQVAPTLNWGPRGSMAFGTTQSTT